MNIIDILLQLITYLAQYFLLPILPIESLLLPFATLKAGLMGLSDTMIQAFGGWGVLFPIGQVLIILSVVITAEITLFVFKIVKYIIEFFKR